MLVGSLFGVPAPAFAASCDAGPFPGERQLSLEQQALLATARELPLETRVGQLLMPGFVGTEPDPGLLDRVSRGRLGGLFLLGRNVRSEEQLKRLTGRLSDAAAGATGGVRPFLATDFEGGIVNALRSVTGNTTSAISLAARGTPGVEAQGAADAETLRWLGFNTNLAPVADVLSAPSQVIGSRAFSSNPTAAAALSRAYLRGLRKGGVLGVMKHFPGHGATEGDSHLMLPVVERSVAQLEASDLVPYRQAIAAGELDAVMLGHLHVPALDPDLPSSLSPAIVLGLLRDRLRFDGLVMTDELKMRAISAQYGVEAAALLAIKAGVDVILADYTGVEQQAVFSALVRACQSGELPAGRIDQSVARILRLKLGYGLAGPDFSARYGAYLAALSAPPLAKEATPTEAAPDPASETGDPFAAPEMAGMPEGEGASTGDGGEMPTMPEVAPDELPSTTPFPTAVSTQPTPTAVSNQPTPTPVSIQPTSTRPPPTATTTSTPSPTATRTPTATPTRAP